MAEMLAAALPWVGAGAGASAAAGGGEVVGAASAAAAGFMRISVPELVAACEPWGAAGGGEPIDRRQMVLHGQLTSRRKLAKDLIFFDVQEPGASIARPSPAAAASAEAPAASEAAAAAPVV